MKIMWIKSSVLMICLVTVLHAWFFRTSPTQTLELFDSGTKKNKIGLMPLRFEVNNGQMENTYQFLAHGHGYNIFLANDGIDLALSSHESGKSPVVLRLNFSNTSSIPNMVGMDLLPGVVNYYTGRDSSEWITGIPTYEKIGYLGVYPGVDAVFYGNQRQVEYDFLVAPGSDPGSIALEIKGADEMIINQDGDLILKIGRSELRLPKPIVYQQYDTYKQIINGGFTLKGNNQFGFLVESYDVNQTLIIDPILEYSSYFGGSDEDYAYDIALDPAGNIYLTGATNSSNFPNINSAQPDFGGGGIHCPSDEVPYRICYDAFVTKLNPSGSTILYSTYIGAPGDDEGKGIAVDAQGNAYIAGYMSVNSESLPDMFIYKYALVAKLNAIGELVYGGWLGTNGSLARDIAVDSEGRVYLTGEANGFITTDDAIQPDRLEIVDAFVTVLDPTGSFLEYSTNLGGSGDYCNLCYSSGHGIAVDNQGMIYVTGQAAPSFPTTTNAYQRTFDGLWKAFVVKIDRKKSGIAGLVYSSYLGGTTLSDFGYDIALDANGKVYITGATQTDDFPTTVGAFDRTCGTDGICNATDNVVCDYTPPGVPEVCHMEAKSDIFVAKFDLSKSGASSLIYSTYIGGGGHDTGYGIDVDSSGNVYVVGKTVSPNFPIEKPVQSVIGGNQDVVALKLNSSGSKLEYSTFLGGGGDDVGEGIVVNMADEAFMVGWTGSMAFPTAKPILPRTGSWEAFISKIGTPVSNQNFSQFLPFVNR